MRPVSLKFMDDPDLVFLQYCNNEDLGMLLKILIGEAGSWQIGSHIRYIKCNGNLANVWDLIAAELQCFGREGAASLFRGQGILYRNIITDASELIGLRLDSDCPIVECEKYFIKRLFERSLEELSKECETSSINEIVLSLNLAMQGRDIIPYNVFAIMANGMAKALFESKTSFTQEEAFGRMIDIMAAPIGSMLINIFSAVQHGSGPGFRQTIPACVQVAYMRQQCLNTNFF